MLKDMCSSAAQQKPASGATTRTVLDLDRSATASPMPVIEVKSGWPKKVSSPRSTNVCCRACSGGTAPMVRAAYR